jgi:tetratricopeptide (TPR) repeat protein
MKKIILLFFFAALLLPTAAQSQNKTVVAVIPFTNLMKDSSFDWLSGGIAETLIAKLSNVDALQMVERIRLKEITDEMKFAASGLVDKKTAAKVGKLVGAQVLVMGAFQKAGNRLRINGRFVEASTGKIIKTAEATGVTDEIFELQDKIAYSLISTLKIQTTAEEDKKITEKPTESFKAYEYMSRGNDYYVNGNMTEAIRIYQKALSIDPDLSGVKYNLGLAYNGQGNPDQAIKQFAEVLSAKPNDKWSLIMTGNAYKMKGDHQNAILYYQRVLDVFPDDVAAHGELGVLYRRLGDREKATAHFSKISYMLKNFTPSTLELDLNKDIFSVRVYNTDDASTVTINGRVAVKTKYAEDSGFVDIMKFLKKGENTIRLTTVNLQIGGWTYGYQIKKNDYVVWEAQDGVCGEWGAQNNDAKTGVVFDKKITVMVK